MIKEGLLLVAALLILGQRVFMYQNWRDFSKDTLPYTAFNLPQPLNYSLYRVRVYHHPAPLIHLIHLHGNGINVNASQWHYGRLYHGLRATVIAPEYDGYDETPSFTSQEKICSRARLQYEYIRGLLQPKNVPLVVLGASLGTGVASCMLEERAHGTLPDALIMENAFTSVYDVVPLPLRWLLYDHWRVNISDAVRTLYIISEQDGVIPPSHGRVLAKRSLNATRAVLAGCNHGDAPAHSLYLPKIRKFLHSALHIKEYIQRVT